MKTFVAFFVLFAVALARDICFPEVFTTDQMIYLPSRQDVLFGQLAFSLPAQHMREDLLIVVDDDKRVHEKISILTDFSREVEYTIAYKNNTAKCTKRTIQGKLQPLCLTRNPKHRGTLTIGGDLYCDNWVEIVQGRNGTRAVVDVLATAEINIPVRSFTRGEHQPGVMEEYVNFRSFVAHDAWVVPQECYGKEAEGFTTAARSLRNAHPLLENTRLVASQEQ